MASEAIEMTGNIVGFRTLEDKSGAVTIAISEQDAEAYASAIVKFSHQERTFKVIIMPESEYERLKDG